MFDVLFHDLDFLILVLRKPFFKVLNAECSLELDFGVIVFEALADKLQDKVAVILLDFWSELFRHVPHGHNNIHNQPWIAGVQNRQHQAKDILELALVRLVAVFSQH